jgi:hypothetical protein
MFTDMVGYEPPVRVVTAARIGANYNRYGFTFIKVAV